MCHICSRSSTIPSSPCLMRRLHRTQRLPLGVSTHSSSRHTGAPQFFPNQLTMSDRSISRHVASIRFSDTTPVRCDSLLVPRLQVTSSNSHLSSFPQHCPPLLDARALHLAAPLITPLLDAKP